MNPPPLLVLISTEFFSLPSTISSHGSLAKATILRQIFFHPFHSSQRGYTPKRSRCFHNARHIVPRKSWNPCVEMNPGYGDGKPPRGFVWRRVNDSYYCRSLFALSITEATKREVLQPRAPRVRWLEREGESSPSWYEVVNQRATKHRPWYVDFLSRRRSPLSLSLCFSIILLFITTCQLVIYITPYRGGRIWFFNMLGRKRVYFYWFQERQSWEIERYVVFFFW